MLLGNVGARPLPLERTTCSPVTCLQDGSSLLAGCSDGAIRLYGPQSGQLRRVLAGAHQAAVTALAVAGDGQRLYSGDACGAFKAWRLGPQSHTMLAALKEHKVSGTVWLQHPPGVAQAVQIKLALRSSLQTLGAPAYWCRHHMYESFSALRFSVDMVD